MELPDSAVVFFHTLARADVSTALLLFQPALTEYNLADELPPRPASFPQVFVPTNAKFGGGSTGQQSAGPGTKFKLKTPDSIVLVDSFSKVWIIRGEQVQSWMEAGYHLNSGLYENLRELLREPIQHCRNVVAARVPVPEVAESVVEVGAVELSGLSGDVVAAGSGGGNEAGVSVDKVLWWTFDEFVNAVIEAAVNHI